MQTEDMSIMGHLTGGTAALNLYLRNPGLYRSASALAPILDVTQDRAALSELVGEDAQEYLLEGGILEARMWNPIDLIKELDVEDVHITMNMVSAHFPTFYSRHSCEIDASTSGSRETGQHYDQRKRSRLHGGRPWTLFTGQR